MMGLGVYVHFPWCLKKCPYCDFLSLAVKSPDPSRYATWSEARQVIPHTSYANAVISEFDARFTKLWRDVGFAPALTSLFFGGGTPSLWEPRELGRVIRHVLEHVDRVPSAPHGPEITVECNPTSVDYDHFKALLDVGVNRISIGVQGLNRERLDFLGRLHDPDQALRAIDLALDAGMPSVSADLIYGIYRQAPEQAVDEVTAIAARGVHHLSAYMLTIEENTKFGAMHRQGKLPLLDDALVARSFSSVREALAGLGFEHYEVSNFARPGARSVHNTGYWLGRDYLGLGTGSYGTVSLSSAPDERPRRLRYRNFISPERYTDCWLDRSSAVDPFGPPSTEQEWIDSDTAMDEALLLGLRLRDGVDVDAVTQLRGTSEKHQARLVILQRLLAAGKLIQRGTVLKIPEHLWIVADGIIRELI